MNTFPNGKVIQDKAIAGTIIQAIQYTGIENVRNLNVRINNDNPVTKIITPTYKTSLKLLLLVFSFLHLSLLFCNAILGLDRR